MRLSALFRLAFAAAPGVRPLNLATKSNSLAHSPKGTRSGLASPERNAIALPLLVSTRFQVLFHSGYPGSFHLSLTVLVHYRSPRVFSLGRWSSLLPTGLACPVVLKVSTQSSTTFAYEGLTPCAHAFQRVRLAVEFVTLSSRCYDSGAPVNPHPATHAGYHTRWV